VLKAYILLENAKEMAGVTADELSFTAEDLAGLPFDDQVDKLLDELDLRSILGEDVDRAGIRRYLEVRLARHRSQSVYRPGVYPGRIILFRAQDVYTDTTLSEAAEIFEEVARSPTYGWDALCTRPIEVVDVPGNHESLVHEPHVRELARAMSRALSEAAELAHNPASGGSLE
jgi:thioesterase domain-containing protein